MSGKRISLELPEELVEKIDCLRKDWKIRSRGECLRRLLEEIFQPDGEEQASSEVESENLSAVTRQANQDFASGDATTVPSPISPAEEQPLHPRYDEDRAIVLVGSNGVVGPFSANNSNQQERNVEAPPKRSSGGGGGIDLPGFVRKRSSAIRESLSTPPQANAEIPVVPVIRDSELQQWFEVALNHWINLYGSSPGATVMEAVMLWMARDIWPHIDGSEGRTFTWSQVNQSMQQYCNEWMVPSPRFEQVIVAVAVLEDPFASGSVPDRIPTLIRRFVSGFKRSRKVTSFETLESTMTLHGALKQLDLPTQAGHSLTLRSIRDAYKRKAVEVHPDSGGSTEAMRRLNEAYQMLKELYRQKEASS